MRFYLIWLAFIFMSAYAWKDWHKSLCFLVLSMAIFERPDFPKEMLGIPGFNPWNLLFLNIVLAFKADKRIDKIRLPGHIKKFYYFYLLVILISFTRAIVDMDGMTDYSLFMGFEPWSKKDLVIEMVINTVKYAVPGIIIYFAADSRDRIDLSIWSIVLMNFLLAMLVIKVMPISALTDGRTLEQTGIRKIDNQIGYYRTDLSILFSGAAWAIYVFRSYITNFYQSYFLLLAFLATSFAIALTGSRIGMGAWIVIGTFFACVKWKKYLILGPLMVSFVVALVPAAQERFFQGIPDEEQGGGEQADYASVTSGRTDVWPYMLEEIGEHPFFGQGRKAMQRSGLSTRLNQELSRNFAHPHNAYLQTLLDNGILLSLPLMIFWLMLLKYSYTLLRDNRNKIYFAVGGVAFSLIIAQLMGFVAQQSFYPFSSLISAIFAIGIMLRVYFIRRKADREGLDHSQLFLPAALSEKAIRKAARKSGS